MKYFTNLKFDVWVCNPTMPVQMYFPVKYFIFVSHQFTQMNSVFSINFDLAPSWKRISIKDGHSFDRIFSSKNVFQIQSVVLTVK